jgi:hypothetical protein
LAFRLIEQLIDHVGTPAIEGVFEGLAVFALTSLALPLLTRRATLVADCLDDIEFCCEAAIELIDHRLSGLPRDSQLERKVGRLRGSVGRSVTKAFGRASAGFDQNFMEPFLEATGLGDSQSVDPLPPDAIERIASTSQALRSRVRREAAAFLSWRLFRGRPPSGI